MPINFPDSPSVNDTHTVGDKTWTWDGTSWNVVTAASGDHGNLGGLSDDDHTQYLRVDGTRSADSLTISDDLTVDTDTLHVDSTNNRVGIGTTSPTVTLHVDSGSTDQYAAPQIYIAPSGHASSDRAAIQLDDIQLLTDIFGNGTEDFSIYSNNAAAHRLSIDGSGNVGIGTTTPSYKLDVNGDVGISSTGTAFDPTVSITTTSSTAYNHAINAFNPNLTANEGNIIVVGKSGATKNSGYVGWLHSSDGSDNNLISMGHWGNNWLLNVAGNGNVGIGTTTPSYKLDVNGPEDTASRVNISSGNTAYRYHMRFSRNGSLLANGIFSDTGTTYFGNASDVNLKTGISDLSKQDALTAVSALRPVEYRYLLDADDVVRKGFIAQEMVEVIPEAVHRVGGGHPATSLIYDENGDLVATDVDENGDPIVQQEPDWMMTWEPITTTLVAAVQAQQELIQELNARIEALESA